MKVKTIDYERDGLKITIPSYMEPQKDAIIDYLIKKLLERLEGQK